MLRNARTKKMRDQSFSIFRLYISIQALFLFAAHWPWLLIRYLSARNNPPFCLLSRAERSRYGCLWSQAVGQLSLTGHRVALFDRNILSPAKISRCSIGLHARSCRFHSKFVFPICPLSGRSFKEYLCGSCFCFEWILENVFLLFKRKM